MESTAILTYGSLLDPSELADAYEDVSYSKVKLEGFCRHFAQKGTFRRGENGEDCVASVAESEGDWVSALIITGLTEEEYDEYVERESGYTIREVSPDSITFYSDEEPWALDSFDEILLPVGDRPVETVDPVPSYVRLCTEGAFKHGDEFGMDFVFTTRLEA